MRLYKEHSKEVTDLCFDGSAEYLASCSADGSAAVSGGVSGAVCRAGQGGAVPGQASKEMPLPAPAALHILR